MGDQLREYYSSSNNSQNPLMTNVHSEKAKPVQILSNGGQLTVLLSDGRIFEQVIEWKSSAGVKLKWQQVQGPWME